MAEILWRQVCHSEQGTSGVKWSWPSLGQLKDSDCGVPSPTVLAFTRCQFGPKPALDWAELGTDACSLCPMVRCLRGSWSHCVQYPFLLDQCKPLVALGHFVSMPCACCLFMPELALSTLSAWWIYFSRPRSAVVSSRKASLMFSRPSSLVPPERNACSLLCQPMLCNTHPIIWNHKIFSLYTFFLNLSLDVKFIVSRSPLLSQYLGENVKKQIDISIEVCLSEGLILIRVVTGHMGWWHI